MKKGFITLLVFAVTLTLSFGFLADNADAKRGGGGGFKSNKQSFTQQKTDTKQSDKASATQSSTKNTNTSSSTQGTKQGGLFGNNGGFLKGMLFGSIAGMLFGSMFGTGAFGQMLTALFNIIIIFGIIMVIRALWIYIRNNKKTANNGPNYNRYYDYNRNEEDKENKR